jgi:aspartyl protease family protein
LSPQGRARREADARPARPPGRLKFELGDLTMRLLAPLALLAFAGIALFGTPPDAPIFGLDHNRFAGLAFGAALLLWLLLSGARQAGPAGLARAFASALTWAALIVGLTGLYAYRFEFADIADRVIGELNPSEPTIGQGGEVIVVRRFSGEFVVPAKVNNATAQFLFDTGASSVVVRAEDARRMGLNVTGLDYEVSVTTANGGSMAAPVILSDFAVGPIVIHDVRALVARPGALSENLLGMSFLERLKSYSVERGKLVLKAR